MLTLKYSHSAPTRPRILSRNSKLHCTLLFAAVQLQRTERINTFAFVSLSEALGTEHEPFSVFTLVLFLVDSIRLYFFQFFRIQKKTPKITVHCCGPCKGGPGYRYGTLLVTSTRASTKPGESLKRTILVNDHLNYECGSPRSTLYI